MNTITSGSRISHHPIADAHTKDAKADKTHNQQDAQAHNNPATANAVYDNLSFRKAFQLAPAPIAAQLKLGAKALTQAPAQQAGQSQKNDGKAQTLGKELAQATLTRNEVINFLHEHKKIFEKLDKDGNGVISKDDINKVRTKIFDRLDSVRQNGKLSKQEIQNIRPRGENIIKICNSLVPLSKGVKDLKGHDISTLTGENVSKIFGRLAKIDGNDKNEKKHNIDTISKRDIKVATNLEKIKERLETMGTKEKDKHVPPPPTWWTKGKGDYSFVVVPDPQSMIRYDAYAMNYGMKLGLGTRLGQWVANHKTGERIKYALSVGDNVNNASNENSWKAQKRMYERFNIPLYSTPGNHDYNYNKGQPRTLDDYLLTHNPKALEAYDAKKYDPDGTSGAIDGASALYKTKTGSLILTLESSGKDVSPEVLSWASDALTNHPKRDVTILTHANLKKDGTLPPNLNDFVKDHPNVHMAFSGHYPVDEGDKKGKMPPTMLSKMMDGNARAFLADAQRVEKKALNHGKLPLGMVLRVRMDGDGNRAQLLYYSTVRHEYYGSMEVDLKTGAVSNKTGHVKDLDA